MTSDAELAQNCRELLARTRNFPKLHAQAEWLTNHAQQMRDRTRELPAPVGNTGYIHDVPADVATKLWEIREKAARLWSFRQQLEWLADYVESCHNHIAALKYQQESPPTHGFLPNLWVGLSPDEVAALASATTDGGSPQPRRCAKCGHGYYCRVTRPGRVEEYRGIMVELPAEVALMECDVCHEILMTPQEMEALAPMIEKAYRARHGAPLTHGAGLLHAQITDQEADHESN